MIGFQHFRNAEIMIAVIQRVADPKRTRRDQCKNTRLLRDGQTVRKQFADAVHSVNIGCKGSDAHHRHRGGNARIHRAQPHRLVSPAGGSGRADPVLPDKRKTAQKVHAAHVVHDLRPHQGLPDIEQARAEKTAVPLLRVTGIRPFVGAEGVHHEADITAFHQSQGHGLRIVRELALRIVAVHLNHAGERSLPGRHVKQRRDKYPGTALINQFRNGEIRFPDRSELADFQRKGPVVAASEFPPQFRPQPPLKTPEARFVGNHIQLMQTRQTTSLETQKAVDLAIGRHVQMEQTFPRIRGKIEIPHPDS